MPRCPACNVPMTRVETEALRHCTCHNCFGHWVHTSALKRQCNLDAKALAQGLTPEIPGNPCLSDLAAVVAESHTRTTLRCAECSQPMQKDRFHAMIPVEIDRCRKCDFLWLDAGELNLLRKLFHELTVSDDPHLQRVKQKVAAVNSELDRRKRDRQDARSSGSWDILSGVDGVDVVDILGSILRLAR